MIHENKSIHITDDVMDKPSALGGELLSCTPSLLVYCFCARVYAVYNA
jgi:hypothetical protein